MQQGVGYALAVATQLAAFPALRLRVGVTETLGLGLIFTAVSLILDCGLRRLFGGVRHDRASTVIGSIM